MPTGAYHTAELVYVFQADVMALAPRITQVSQLNPAQRALSDQIIRYWSGFARRGNPNSTQDPAWLPSPLGDLQLAPGTTGMRWDFYLDHKCAFWDTLTAL
jgi:para-nitrobenzyl esterase